MSNSNLLDLVNFEDTLKNTPGGTIAPQLIELTVNPELAPFLVSSTRSVVWVERAGSHNQLRAAVRAKRGLESDIIVAIAERGARENWGNVHPLTTEGVQKCAEHLRFYGFDSLEVLVAPDTNVEHVDFQGLPTVKAPWVPLGAVVVVPLDRSFVGSLGVVGKLKALALVHNASRGVGIAHQ